MSFVCLPLAASIHHTHRSCKWSLQIFTENRKISKWQGFEKKRERWGAWRSTCWKDWFTISTDCGITWWKSNGRPQCTRWGRLRGLMVYNILVWGRLLQAFPLSMLEWNWGTMPSPWSTDRAANVEHCSSSPWNRCLCGFGGLGAYLLHGVSMTQGNSDLCIVHLHLLQLWKINWEIPHGLCFIIMLHSGRRLGLGLPWGVLVRTWGPMWWTPWCCTV